MDFEMLPEEIKLMIFSHFSTRELISTIAPVSEFWEILALKPTLWKDIEFNGKDKNCPIAVKDIVKQLHRCHLARQIEFSLIKDFNWSLHLNVLEFVRKLVFNYCNVGAWEIFQFTKKCPNVDSFCFVTYGSREDECWLQRNCSFRNRKVKLAMIEQITKWEKLKSLKLSYGHCETDDEILTLVANRCKMIEELGWINRYGVPRESFRTLIEQCGPRLKSLELTVPNVGTSVFKLIQECNKMETIILINSQIYVHDFIKLSTLPKLKRLELRNCFFFPNNNLEIYGDFRCKLLEDAAFGEFNWSREIIEEHFSQLKTIDGYSIDEYFQIHDK